MMSLVLNQAQVSIDVNGNVAKKVSKNSNVKFKACYLGIRGTTNMKQIYCLHNSSSFLPISNYCNPWNNDTIKKFPVNINIH